uniref:Uncharacterized protein n=1 Tax=Anguilla anguilla TaxID=7936 RepID=A0A0E9PNX1_ANGAN
MPCTGTTGNGSYVYRKICPRAIEHKDI